MPSQPENPILYRAAREAQKAPPWQRLVLHLAIPALMILPSAFLVAGDFPDWGLERLVRSLQGGFAMSAFLVACLIPVRALAGTVSAFTRERELRTLEGLLASRLGPRDLFLGKLAAALRPLALDFALALPFWGLFVLWGGARPEQALALQGLLVSYTLFAALLGTWCSLRERTSLAAGTLAFGIVAGLVVAGPALDLLLLVTDVRTDLGASVTSPGMVLLLLLRMDLEPKQALWMIPTSVGLYLAGAALLYSLGLGRLRRLHEGPRPARTPGRRDPLRGFLARSWENPVWFRHLLARETGGSRLGRLLRASGVPLLILAPALLALLVRWDSDWVERLSRSLHVGFAFTAVGFALLFPARALAAGARSVAGEREQRTLEPLLGSRTGPGELVAGLLAVAVGLPALELLAWSPVLALFACSNSLDLAPVGALVGFTLAGIALGGTLGLWLSAGEPSPGRALQKGWAALLGLTLGTFLLDACLNLALPGSTVYLFTGVNPLLAMVSALAGEPRQVPHLWVGCAVAWLVTAGLLVRATARRLGPAE